MSGIDDIGRMQEILDSIRSNVATKPGTKYYVSSTHGNDNYGGLSRDDPVHSINTAIGLAGHGDIIHIARDTYDEAVSIPAGKIGLQIICEPGVYLINTTPGTVVAVASACVYWEGGILETNGQIALQVNDQWFIGKNIRAYNSSVGFDMLSDHPILINCRTNETATAGFNITGKNGFYIDCDCHGLAASRGFYLSHTNAHNNIFKRCSTVGCTAGGYECVAGADENLFSHCSQSSLCAGPTDAGANNTWPMHTKGSQIAAGNTIDDDLSAIETYVDELESRLTAARAGYLDELAAANIPTDLATIQAYVDELETRLTAVRAGYLDELAAANIPADIDTLLTRLTAARAGYLNELAAANIPADIDTLLTRLTAARAGYLDELAAANIPADIDELKTSKGRQLFSMDFWSAPQEELSIPAVAATRTLPSVTVADLPAGVTIVRAIAMLKFRMVDNINAGANKLNGATVASTSQVIQVRDDTPGTWRDAINFVDDQFGLAATTREGGDVLIGSIDIAVEVDGNDTYNFQYLLARADLASINWNDLQTGLRILYSV